MRLLSLADSLYAGYAIHMNNGSFVLPVRLTKQPCKVILQVLAHAIPEGFGCSILQDRDEFFVGDEGFQQGLLLEQTTVMYVIKNGQEHFLKLF